MLIRVFLHGLLLFVPDSKATNHMYVLLVDGSKNEGMEKVCFVPHTPTIEFPYVTFTDCTNAGCSKGSADNLCKCTITKRDITLIPASNPAATNFLPQPDSDLPSDKTGDFSYIVNVTRLKDNSGVHYGLVSDYINSPSLVARMSLTFDSLTTCNFATRQDEGFVNASAFTFRPVGSAGKGQLRHALGQVVMAKINLPADVHPMLGVAYLGGAAKYIPLQATNNEITITLANDRDTIMFPDDPCEDGVGRDFAFLYDILVPATAWTDRSVPHVKATSYEPDADFENDECAKHAKLPMSRPVCPPAALVVP
jgi:hypothetical protein